MRNTYAGRKIEVPKDHPYYAKLSPSVYELLGKWIVKWRSFDGIKQDAEFKTEQEARAFAAQLKTRTIKLRPFDYHEHDAQWRD